MSLADQIANKGKPRGGKGGAGAGAGAGPTDSALHEEISKGTDKLWMIILAPYEHVGDMFEVYCLKNVFAWPTNVPAARPGGGSGRVYSAAEEKAADARIAKLEEAIVRVRMVHVCVCRGMDLFFGAGSCCFSAQCVVCVCVFVSLTLLICSHPSPHPSAPSR